MYIIGISSGIKHGHHDGGAVLMKDGELIAASEEERFTLAKHARGELPRRAIKFCLDFAGIKIQDVDYICSPLITYKNYDKRLSEWAKFHFGYSPKIALYDHHLCHAASTYYPSGFNEGTILCLDNSGDSCSGLVAHGKGNEIKVVHRFPRHNSLGLYYGMLTQFMGYNMTHDEYKVMGLASYGKPRFQNEFAKILRSSDDYFELNQSLDQRLKHPEIFTSDFSTRQERIFTEELENLLGPRRLPGMPIDQHFTDIAASGQRQLEEICIHVAKKAIAQTGCPDICMAGGVGLNIQANMRITEDAGLRKIFVPPVPHDAGVALGAAILKAVEHGHKIFTMKHAYYGPAYDNAKIEFTLKQVGAKYTKVENITDAAARDLIDQKHVGWFQGRMEFGPRALGSRSILADPSNLTVKNRINEKIKYREEYRPFCPSVLMEKQGDYFKDTFEAPYMAINFRAKEDAREKLPAVVHVDNTARIQSVNASTNPLYHELISKFHGLGGPPVLLNTSLNVNEQPLVNAPLEALHTYFCSGLDVMYLGNYRLSKV